MISALDETIRHIFIEAGGFDPSEIDISFDIPNREWSTGISRPTVNCYLFDIRENNDLRQQGWQMDQPGKASAARRYAPLRMNLTYLITAWTRAIEDEHRLLWHALGTLIRFRTLPNSYLQGELQEHESAIYADIAQSKGILQSSSEFWAALDNHLKPSLQYTLTLTIDRDAIAAGPPVLTTNVRVHHHPHSVEQTDDDGVKQNS